MHNNSFFKIILLVSSVFLLYSCDKDYNVIGEDLIDSNHFTLKDTSYNVLAYNQKITPIQSNNLNINPLGIHENPAFGNTAAHFATQMVLGSVDPVIDLNLNPVIDSVYLTVPYYSTLKSTDASGNKTYELDSIYAASDAKINLSVFESGYYMRDLDPNGEFQESQKYYTDQNSAIDNLKIGARLNDDINPDQNDAFFFSAKEIVELTTDKDGKKVTTRMAPQMRLKLNNDFFKNKIILAPAGKLKTNDVFKEYFRGLYFKVEKSGSNPSGLAMLDFKKGKITIKYRENTSGTDATRVDKTITLNLSGNTVSLLEQSNTNANYENATNTPNRSAGDDKLYLKGGEGSMAIVELFGADNDNDGVADELEIIRSKGWLINEANLVFHIDAENMANSFEPNRVYVYDLTNNRPLVDYFLDASTNSSNPKKAKSTFGGFINKEAVANGRGVDYKIRITNQIRSLVKNADSTNIKLGVVVTEDIATSSSNKLKTPNEFISQAPKASVMNPLGTIIFGGTSTVPTDKRLKLQIYYTKPN